MSVINLEEIQRAYLDVPDLLEESNGSRVSDPSGYVKSTAGSQELTPKGLKREHIPNFPELSELQVVRHFTRLSHHNFSIDSGFYPLGSCTMKYNPKVNELVASQQGFADLHPFTPETYCQGALEVMYRLQQALVSITGMRSCSLHPAAGAHGELVGVKMIHAYHRDRGDHRRKNILIPDSAHGTNPASVVLSGLKVKKISTGKRGTMDVTEVEKQMDDSVAAIMFTQPNTLGIFEDEIVKIAKIVHDRGGLLYCDGANLNALVGQVDFGKTGVDVMHINLHKTFSTPHGGGGPGAGPVVVSERLDSYLPIPIVKQQGESFVLSEEIPKTVGRFRCFHGNFTMLVRALCYIYAFGKEKLPMVSEVAVLKANYLKHKLKEFYHLPFDAPSLHEVVLSDKWLQKENAVTTMDLAKRLMDFGVHPPTVYFPLVVPGAIMIEPTECEPKWELDRFIEAMKRIAEEARATPEKVKTAPHKVGLKRLNETLAARKPVLTWNDLSEE